MRKSLAVYIHIPFCVRKCRYCDFPSFDGENDMIKPYFDALFKEIDKEEETKGRKADTLYIGGGTPSSVPPEFIAAALDRIREKYDVSPDAEISMEVNPGTIGKEALKIYRESGVNRISIGCQSFNDKSLRRLGRIHLEKDIHEAYDMVRSAGFDNVNLDLISSLPGESRKELERSVKEALKLKPEHLSVYSLIIEPGTAFFKEREQGLMADLPEEEEVLECDKMVREILKENGYVRYEISNFAKEGRECAHNLKYWNRADYRGYGLGAASLIGNRRFTNIRDMVYIKSPGGYLEEDRVLTDSEEMEEFMFLGLRKTRGVSRRDFKEAFSKELEAVFGEQLEGQIRQGYMDREDDRYFYNDRGLDVSNLLLSEFLSEF